MAERWDERERAYRRDEREYHNRDSGERDRTDRAADEVKSWFGDDAASQRRRMFVAGLKARPTLHSRGYYCTRVARTSDSGTYFPSGPANSASAV